MFNIWCYLQKNEKDNNGTKEIADYYNENNYIVNEISV